MTELLDSAAQKRETSVVPKRRRHISISEFWTVILALATVLLAGATFYLALEARQASYRQIGVETWVRLQARFDSQEMQNARKTLAEALDPDHPKKDEEVPNEVFDFFESVGALYNHRPSRIARDLAENTFSYDAQGWWDAGEGYIQRERGRTGDRTSYQEFEAFAKAMRAKYPAEVNVREFLKDAE